MNIRLKATVIILLVIGITGGSAIHISSELSRNALEDQISDHLITTAQSRADHIETFLNSRKLGAEAYAIQVGSYNDYYNEHGKLPGGLDFILDTGRDATFNDEQILIIGQDGELDFGVGRYGFMMGLDETEGEEIDLSGWEVFLEASDKTCVMDTRLEELTQDTVLAVAAPYYTGEEMAGVFVMLGAEAELARIASDLTGMGDTGEVYVVNKDGYMITPSRIYEGDYQDIKVDLKGKEIDPAAPMDVFLYKNYLGVDVIGVHNQMPETGWTVIAEISTSEAYAPISNLTHTMLYVLGGILVWGILLAFLMSRMIIVPLLKLQKGAETVMQGNLSHRISLTRGDELGKLSAAFDKMTASLQQSREELEGHASKLETRVQERTSQLEAEVVVRRQGEDKLREIMSELRRSNEDLEQFAYVASHDLQEPLRMVTSYMQLLERRYKGILDSDADEFINYAVDGATRMRNMITALLDYSRVGTHGKPFEKVEGEVVFDQALSNLEVTIVENEAIITHDPLPAVLGDHIQLVQLFQNLIGNAIKFHGEDRPCVHINATQQRFEGDWMVSVSDNGVGIDPEYADRVFEIFHRLHTKEEYPGTGIGLSVCRKIVERHGGRIWMESDSGKGSTFYFTIPMREDVDDNVSTGGWENDQYLAGRR